MKLFQVISETNSLLVTIVVIIRSTSLLSQTSRRRGSQSPQTFRL